MTHLAGVKRAIVPGVLLALFATTAGCKRAPAADDPPTRIVDPNAPKAASKQQLDPRQAILGRWQVARPAVEGSAAYKEIARADAAGAERMLNALTLLTLQISDDELRIEGPGPARRVFFDVGAVAGARIELKPRGEGAPMAIEVKGETLVLEDRAHKLPLILTRASTAASPTGTPPPAGG